MGIIVGETILEGDSTRWRKTIYFEIILKRVENNIEWSVSSIIITHRQQW